MIFSRETAAVTSAAATTGRSRNRMRAVLVTGVLVAAPVAGLVTATGASAADTSAWDTVAQCESTGNWSANTGNGFYGGLQFTPSTWAAFGGTAYAASADQATEGQQIAVAEQVLASQGPGAWPVCSVGAGLTAGGSAATVDTSSKTSNDVATSATDSSTATASAGATDSAPAAAAPAAVAPATTTGGNYTVKSGDTLGSIAAAHGTDWQSLYAANHGTVGADPDVIYPGQTLTVG
jgi:LysM repeat protein